MRIDRGRGILSCDYCGAERELPWAVDKIALEGETKSPCPVCRAPLSTSRIEGHHVLCCARCFGMLIDMSRFAAVIDAVRAGESRTFQAALPRRQTPGDRVIPCPTCQQPMLSHLYGGPGNIVIDTCETCHVNWLDDGELRRAAMAPERVNTD
jgi:Zn-finger nucleic acid-binding protein